MASSGSRDMSAAEVREQLERFESLSRARGSTLMSRVGAGLTPDAIGEIEDANGISLTADAREVWLWHNGLDMATTPSFWGTGYWFPDLETAIERGQTNLAIRNSGDVNTYPGATWITLGGGSIGVVIDITDPTCENSPVYVDDPTAAVDEYPIVTLAERIGWWCWAIENGVHYVTATGGWQWDTAKVPTGPERNLM